MHLCLGVQEGQLLLVDHHLAGGRAAALAHLLGLEGVGAEHRHAAQQICRLGHDDGIDNLALNGSDKSIIPRSIVGAAVAQEVRAGLATERLLVRSA